MPLVQTRGAASAQGFGEFAQVTAANYIENVFSIYLYTGTGASLTITNNIDLSTKGGLVWLKCRSTALGAGHKLTDTARGAGNALTSNATYGSLSEATLLSSFNTTGFTLGAYGGTNNSGDTFVSWSLRKQPKFFDIQTWTGSGANRTIAHSLGSVPGSIWVKRTDTTGDWQVYHRSLANTQYLVLNDTTAAATGATRWNSTTPTSTEFSLGTDATVNASAGTYIAYIFAHNAGGFGLTGTDNVISCGDFTTDGSGNATVNLGYEPQYILMKLNVNGAVNWVTYDIMRGWGLNNVAQLYPNITQAEDAYTGGPYFFPTATGFTLNGTFGLGNNQTNAYIAIRRGPMKVPTTGTSVFSPYTRAGTNAAVTVTGVGFSPDLVIANSRTAGYLSWFYDRLRGTNGGYLIPSSTGAEGGDATTFITISGIQDGYALPVSNPNRSIATAGYVDWQMKRAPSFFDEVCYTGNSTSGRTVTHNLTTVPELIIVKDRGNVENWVVYSAPVGNTKELFLNRDSAPTASGGYWNSTTPTSTIFTVGPYGVGNNDSGVNYVAYLFATCAGVSKVGSYTGTGTTQTINCGFTAGARFVLIKRTDSTGDWYVWDSARGIVAGNDPYLLLNANSGDITGTDYIDTYSAGFEISSTAPAAINASAGTFIFLAIA